MEKKDIQAVLKYIKENSSKRNFKQSLDFIINFKGLDLKKTENQFDLFVPLHFSTGHTVKICAFVAPELLTQAKENCDLTISIDDFPKYQDKKAAKKLAEEYDYFIAQATIMPKVATTFGKVFGPRGKMPNPKAGCVVPPNANLKQVCDKLKNMAKVSVKKDPLFQCTIGKEDSNEDEVIDTIMTIYNAVIHHLPGENNNIKSVFLKLTMGPPAKIGADLDAKKAVEVKKKEPKTVAVPKEVLDSKKELPKEKKAEKE